MKQLLLAAALAGAAGGAYAADLVESSPAPIIVDEAMFDWTGMYVGVQAGYVSGNVETEDWFCVNNPGDCYGAPEDRYFADIDVAGFKGGIHAGYNHQFGMFVLGAESDLNLSGVSGDGGFVYFDDSEDTEEPGNEEETSSFDMLWEGSTRLKVGLAFDRFMPYLTGGVAYGQADITAHREFENGPHDFEYSGINLIGYTVGLGAAYAMTDEIIVHGEGRFTDFGTTTAAGVDPADGETHDIEVVGPAQFSMEAGISFKF
jgi:outer membrane immunogenic protein